MSQTSFQHYYTVEGVNGTIPPEVTLTVLTITSSGKTYSEGVIANDSTSAVIECYVNDSGSPFRLLAGENFEFQFTITDIQLKNLSGSETASYRVMAKRRVEEPDPV